MISRRGIIRGSLALALGGVLFGCGEPTPVVDFQAAEQSGTPVTVSGRLEPMSVRQQSGQPTTFTLREEETDRRLEVRVPPQAPVPSNLVSATHATVTGTYNATDRVFEATRVEPRVPPREEQSAG